MIFGWDVSTSIVGATAFTDDCKFIKSYHIDLRKMDAANPIDKACAIEQWVNEIIGEYLGSGAEVVHFVEDRLSSFSFGKTMQQTLLKLAAVNSVVSYIVFKSFKDAGLPGYVVHIHPSTVKAVMKKDGLFIPKGADKKQLTLDFVSKKEPNFPVDLNRNGNPQPWNFDRADSYIVARAGFLQAYLLKDAQGQKTTGTKGVTGA